MAGRALPPDIDPVSRFRLPLPSREGLDEAARKVYDGLVDPGGRSLVGLSGPGGIRLHSPRLAAASQPLSSYVRWEADYEPRIRELAILVTARAHDSQFEWAAHEPEALRVGLAPEIVEIVRHDRPVDGLPETEAAVIALGREVFGAPRVTSETFARALAVFGPKTLVDLVTLMGTYASTAALLKAFDIHLPEGKDPPLPVG